MGHRYSKKSRQKPSAMPKGPVLVRIGAASVLVLAGCPERRTDRVPPQVVAPQTAPEPTPEPEIAPQLPSDAWDEPSPPEVGSAVPISPPPQKAAPPLKIPPKKKAPTDNK